MGKPKIRFKRYEDDWEQRKLGDVLVSLQNNTLSRADLSKEIGVAKNVHYGDVLIKFGEVLDVSKEKLPMILDENVLTKYNASFLQNGDVIVADTAEDSTVGKCSEIAGLIDEVVLSGLHTIPYRPVEKFASGYLGYYLNSNAYHHQLIPLMQGIKVTSISKSAMQDTGIIYPKLIEEQAKIGTYFQSLDHLITLHQRKCEETKSLKKYMLQKMFPENGKCVPEIRFSGFSDDWEQRKFSEFVKNVAVRNREGLELECYAVTNDRGFISQKDAHDDFGYMVDVDTTAYNIVPPNSFAYNPARINVGSIGYYAGTENVIVSSLYEVFQTADYVDDRFLWHWFKSEHFPKWIERLQEGSVRLYFYYDKLIQCEIKMPSLEEQMKIGAYFNHLDHLITLHQHKCDELQKLKKFMLQNMFM
ncbi:restriction endonuclease subunit S [Roseburia faecis]|uniref:restriction endonuclease subunit S n=1 Tax=Roseburia faecis TaxID=301302 RepID=UPI003F99278F